ncbi:MAG: TraB/GumN family protein [Oscillospiraceae bacterium]|nr:TraB/GumN family protein [Oscillospiraceae bacterium]
MVENITRLNYKDKEIILVATAHVSEASVVLTKETIELEQPDSVCVELDEGRYKNIQNPRAWEQTNITQIVREKRVGFALVQLLLSAYQKRLAKKLGTKPGGEMIQGIESAEEIGAQLVLADRNIQTTLLRTWRLLSAKERLKLFTAITGLFGAKDEDDITEEAIAKMLEKDMLSSILEEMQDTVPTVVKVLIHERDQFLANKIKNAPGHKIVAVLGAGHVPGVIEEINKEQDMERISALPQKKSKLKIIKWIIPAIIIGLLAYSFVQNIEMGFQNLWIWWLWNGGLSALFTLLSLGHPLSIATAFLAAPITSFVPFLAAGWFAGLMEAKIRKPRVEDLQNLSEDALHLRRFFKNRVLRVVAVTIMANVGSTIATFVAGAEILRNTFG